jgi:hypothetical protein
MLAFSSEIISNKFNFNFKMVGEKNLFSTIDQKTGVYALISVRKTRVFFTVKNFFFFTVKKIFLRTAKNF